MTTGSSPISEVLRIFFRHKARAFDAALLILGFFWLAILAWPRAYESEAKLFVRIGRESVALDPTATTSQTLLLQKTQEEEINSALEVLNTYQTAQRVVEKIGAERILHGSEESSKAGGTASAVARSLNWAKSLASSVKGFVFSVIGLRDDISDSEIAIRKLRNTIGIYAAKKSAVITITARGKTPSLAHDIVKATIEAFLESHQNVSKTQGSMPFFQSQVTLTESKLRDKLDQLRIYSQEHEIVSVDANREILKDQIARVEQELALTESQLQQADAEIKDLRRKVEEVDAEVVNDKRSTADTTWSGMRTRMYDLELRERELSARFQGSHPELREVQQQLEEAGKILAQVGSERVDKSMTPNPAKLKLEGQLRGELTHVAGLKSKHAELVRQRKRMFGEVEKLLEHEIKMDELEREIGALRSAYAIHMTKLEEARVIEALEAKRISNISVFQPATFVERPAAPNKRLMGAAAIMLAIFGAAGAAYLAEWRNTTLYCPTQVEEALQTQVVATFPLVAVSPGSRGQADNIVLAELRSRCKPIVGELIFRQPENGGDGKKGLSLGVLSCGTGNGGSTVAAALALAASEDCQLSTVLVDSDLRSRFVSRAFQLNGAPGLYELSAKSAEISECVQTSGQRRLALISSSASTSESSATELDASIIACRLEELRPQHDLIVVDLPPASEAQQALTLAASLDRVLLVIEAETTERHQAEQIRAQLARAGKDVVGIVLNKTCDSMPRRSKLSV